MKGVDKMGDLDFIKGFSKISVTEICKNKKINISNMYNKRNQPQQKKNARIVRKEIEKQLDDVYNNCFYGGGSDG